MSRFEINAKEIDRLHEAIKQYPIAAEKSINEVLYNEAPPIVIDAIKQLVPRSRKTWKGKAPEAKSAKNSITERTTERRNLSMTVGTTYKYHYLYFPDDGAKTDRHAGQQFFFARGGEAVQGEIVDRCITKLVNNFEKGV